MRTIRPWQSTALAVAAVLALWAPARGQAEDASGKKTAEKEQDVALATIDAFIEKQTIDKSKENWKVRLPRPPQAEFDEEKDYFWLLDTNFGSIKIEFMPDIAPMHVSSTIYLTRLGFYDGLTFHRVIPGFMAQGGDPLGNGRGWPGYEYDGELSSKRKATHHKGGILSMANRGPGTDGSQFFLTFKAAPHLDGRHTVFGEVVEGMGTLKELEKRGSPQGRPVERLEIRTARIAVE